MFAPGNVVGLEDAFGRPLAGAPVEGLALVDDVVHGADGFLDGGVEVGAVAEDQVDVVELEALQRGVGALDDVFAGEAAVVRAFAAPVDLGGDDVVGAFPAGLGEDGAHDFLGDAVGVDLGVVEEVDAGVPGGVHAFGGEVLVHLRSEGHPRTEAESRDLETRVAEKTIFHESSFPEPRF